MSRPPKGERSNPKGRPSRRAASKTHYFKYQLANNPSRAEEKDLKLALQQSLEEHKSPQPPKRQPKNRPSPKEKILDGDHHNNNNKRRTNTGNNGLKTNTSSSTDSSDLSRSNNSSYSNESAGFVVINALKQMKRTRASSNSSSNRNSPAIKRAKLTTGGSVSQKTNGHVSKTNNHSSASSKSSQPKTAFITTIDISSCSSSSSSSNTPSPLPPPKAIRTYSRCPPDLRNNNQDNSAKQKQQPVINSSTPINRASVVEKGKTQQKTTPQNCQVNGLKGSSCNKISVSKSTQTDLEETADLSKKRINQNQATNVKLTKKRSPQGSWSLLGAPEEKTIYLRDDEPPRRMICYPAIKHVEGDVIQVRDSVLLRSGARKTDLPYIAKVCSFWQDAETGNVMMSLFWYYRPEHTEDGRKPHHLPDEIFASRHRDVDSVECIEDKCYVLTFNEYCRYKKRCKMEQVNATWSLTDVTIPVSNESYPRRNRIPSSDVNPELVFCCRQIYDSRMRRLIKNPLINPKYGHI